MPTRPKTNSQKKRESSPFKDFYEKQKKLRQKVADKRRGTAASRGYNYKWQKARASYLIKHPLCSDCLERGITTAANEVHHTIKPEGDWKLFWDSSKWLGLCKPCHMIRTARGE